MNRLKRISIIWGIVAVLLFAFLTAIGFIYKNKTQKYTDLDKELVKVTKSYTATDFKFPINGEEIIITFEELKNAGLIDNLKVDNQKCDGYVEVSFNNVTEYKAFIKCDKYTTHNFKKDKLER